MPQRSSERPKPEKSQNPEDKIDETSEDSSTETGSSDTVSDGVSGEDEKSPNPYDGDPDSGSGFGGENDDDPDSGLFDEDFKFKERPIPEPIPEPPVKSDNVIYKWYPERLYLFIFGTRNAGKTVLLMSLYNYLSTKRIGDTLENINNHDINMPHEKEGNILIDHFNSCAVKNGFPDRTVPTAQDYSGIPRHLNFRFTPKRSTGKQSIEFCFMDMSGEDLRKINFESTEPLPDSIKTYIEDVDQKNLRFIYMLDPLDDVSKQTNLFGAFRRLLDQNNHTNTPVLLLVSKWDTVTEYDDVKTYIQEVFPSIWAALHSEIWYFSFADFSIGTVDAEEEERIIKFDSSYPHRVFNWIYTQYTGEQLDEVTDIPSGTESIDKNDKKPPSGNEPKKESRFRRFFQKYF